MQQERKPSILEDSKYSLFAKRPEGGKFAPKLMFTVFKGNVSAQCFPNQPNGGPKSLRLGMSGDLWKYFIQTVNKVLDHNGTIQEHVKVNTGKINDLKEAGTLVVGKSEDGKVYVALKSPQLQSPIKFDLMPTNYMSIFSSDGNPISDGEKSVRYARGYFEIVDKLVTDEIANTWEPYKPQQGGGNRSGGGGNWGNKGGGNNNWGGGSSGGDNLDDIPF